MQTMLFKQAAITLIVFSLDTSSIYAQNAPKNIQLPGVKITAPTTSSAESTGFKADMIIHRDRLRQKREANLGDTLAHELGVTSSSFGPGSGRPIIRGQDGERVRVMENSMGTGDVSVISPDHAVATETLNATRIEILRGPSTLLYGSGVSGGVVNVLNDRIPDRLFKTPQANFEGRFNSALEERSGVLTASGSKGQVSWNIEGMKRKTNDIHIPGRANPNDPESEIGLVRNSAIDSSNLSAGSAYIGERGFVGMSISRLENFYGIPGPEGAKIDMGQTRYGLAGDLDNPLKGFLQLRTRFTYNDYQHKELEQSGEIGSRFKNDELEGRAELTHVPVAQWQGIMGVQLQHRNFTAKGEEAFVPTSLSQSAGIFMVEKRNWQQWQFEIGGRFEHSNHNPRVAMLQTRNFNLYSVSAGAAWKFIEGYQLDLIATRGQRAPNTVALFADGVHIATNTFEQGNSTLNKETSNNFDVALQKTTGRITGRVNLFYNHINDYIFQQSRDSNNDGVADRVDDEGIVEINGPFLVQDFSQTRARFYGLEAEANIALLPDTVNLRLFTDTVYGKLKDNGNIPRITPQRFGFDLNFTQNKWQANFNLTRVVQQDRVAVLETETPGYTLMNTEIGYHMKLTQSVNYMLFLQGRNLLDSDIRMHTSFLKDAAPMAGRAIIGGIRGVF
ncbi:iron complex outermembrane recepter protein [Nitrosomonas ureae]|uniref:Iron complex outermembrane recepter protein n=1 Tax=Nitrosomonas ureae TaxID=44577 RepID=A0A285BZG8_9PROT|nr:TonB-dependent receptor [Nitrosomonas ureae]SNX60599.1 iron complex outermembrane recepter protein [Nitrosomonas ureae]